MNTSRFFGATSREAMRQVRMALGPDALIISNRRVNGGVEILAADSTSAAQAEETSSVPASLMGREQKPTAARPTMIPPPVRQNPAQELMGAIALLKGSLEGRIDELMWSNQLRAKPEQLQLFQQLLTAGFSTSLLRIMLNQLPSHLTGKGPLQWARHELDKHLPVVKTEALIWQPGLALALVGPTGVGKTTTIAKLAARAVRRFGAENVVLITTDTYRIGAHEQLKIYADLLHIPIHCVQNAQMLRQVMLGLRPDQFILIDNVGVSQRDQYVQEQASLLASAGRRIQRILALNAASHGDTLDEVARMYSKDGGSPLAGCVITKIDEANRLGAALDIALRYRLPIHYVSDGQRVPENLRFCSAAELIDMALVMPSDQTGLFAPSTADLAALMSSSHVQQAQHQAMPNKNMIKQVLAFSNLSTEETDIERLHHEVGAVDNVAFCSRAYDLWRELNKSSQEVTLAAYAQDRFRDGVLECADLPVQAPLLVHHISQRLTSEKAQLHLSLIGAADGKIVAAPLVQTNSVSHWYSNSGIQQRGTSRSARKPLLHAMQWVQDQKPPKTIVHWVEEPTNQLWQSWQQEQKNVMALVAPSTRCWHINGYSTPNAIAKQLEFYALNFPKMALPYNQVNSSRVADCSYWYAQTAIELRARSGAPVSLQLFVVQLLDAELKEVKTYFAFGLLDKALISNPEQLAVWLLQHTESKQLLRLVGRAYHHKSLQSFAKQNHADKAWLLELAIAFGGAAWELEQYKELLSLDRMLLQLLGPTALNPTQMTSSLLKLCSLKELLQQS